MSLRSSSTEGEESSRRRRRHEEDCHRHRNDSSESRACSPSRRRDHRRSERERMRDSGRSVNSRNTGRYKETDRHRRNSGGGFGSGESSDSEGEKLKVYEYDNYGGGGDRRRHHKYRDGHSREESSSRRRARHYRSSKTPQKSDGDTPSSDDKDHSRSPPLKRYRRSRSKGRRSWEKDEKKYKEDKPRDKVPEKERRSSHGERSKSKSVRHYDTDLESGLRNQLSDRPTPIPLMRLRIAPPEFPKPPPLFLRSPRSPSPHAPTPSPGSPPYKINRRGDNQLEKKKWDEEKRKDLVQLTGEKCGEKLSSKEFYTNLVRALHRPMPRSTGEVSATRKSNDGDRDTSQPLKSLLELKFPAGTDDWVRKQLNRVPAVILMPPPPAPVSGSSRPFIRPRLIQQSKKCVVNLDERTIDAYEFSKKIGEGTYGKVYKAKDLVGGELVAMKKMRMFNKTEGFPIAVIREIKILRQLCHKNIVNLKQVVTDKKHAREFGEGNGICYLVFEYIPHDLMALLASGLVTFNEDHIASIMKQLLDGLSYCHRNKVIHRDIKPNNILINNKGEVKLADFGLAREWDESISRPYSNKVVTLWYRPPEILLGQENYTPAIDVWSCGCILGELFCKKAILKGDDEIGQLKAIFYLCGSPTPQIWPNVVNLPLWSTIKFKKPRIRMISERLSKYMPPAALLLLEATLALDPEWRATAEEAITCKWLVNVVPENVPPPQLPTWQDCHELWLLNRDKKPDQVEGPSPIPLQDVRYPIPAMYDKPKS